MKKSLLLLSVLLLTVGARTQTYWQPANNGIYGGIVGAIAVAPNGELFAASGNGLYVSKDEGDNWTLTGLNNLEALSIAFGQDSTMFVGTSNGVYRSTDLGLNWNQVGLQGRIILSVFVTTSGSISAGIEPRSNLDSSDVWLSTNNGESWSPRPLVPPGVSAFVSSFAEDSTHGMLCVASTGLFESTDNGTHWNRLLRDIAYSSVVSGSGTIYVGTSDGIFSSANGGVTWDSLSGGLPNKAGFNFMALAINKMDGTLFAGPFNGGIYRSTDGGNAWSYSGLANIRLWPLVVEPNGTILVGTWGSGIYRSSDDGNTWSQINHGFTSAVINAISIQPNGDIFAGVDGGVLCSTDDGFTWEQTSHTLDTLNILSISNAPDNEILAGTNDGLYSSADAGRQWKFAGLSGKQISAVITTTDGEIVAGTNDSTGVWLSGDGGKSWSLRSLNSGAVSSLVVDPNNYGYVYAANLRGVYRSTDNGSNWNRVLTLLNPYPPNLQVSLATNRSGYLFASGPSGVDRSTDHGSSWNLTTLDSVWVSSLCTNSSNYVFAAVGNSIYESTDNGNTWNHLDAGLSDGTIFYPNILSLAASSDGYILAGTYGNGLFRTITSTNGVPAVPLVSSLFQNFPNPFNPVTTIRYDITQKSFVSITVYDVLGRRVATLVNEEKQPGSYQVDFNARGLSSGVYFYRLIAGNFLQMKKLMLIK